MGRNANEVQGGGSGGEGGKLKKVQLKPGSYAARVVQVVFLGVQEQWAFQGKAKDPIDKVRMTYELSTEFMTDEEGKILEDKPRWFSEDFPFHSLKADRAKSTKRYNSLDPSGEAGGDFSKLLGKACQVVIVLNPNKKGKKDDEGNLIVYENVGDVTGAVNLPGYEQPALINPPFYFDPAADDVSLDDFRSIPEWIQKDIQKALDYAGSPLAAKLGQGEAKPADDVKEPEVEGTDDNPY